MADMGIGAGYGAGGAADAIQQIMVRRLQERQLAEQQRQAMAKEAFQQQQLQEQSEYRKAQQDANNLYKQGLLEDKQAKDYETGSKNAFAANEALGSGAAVDPTLQARFDKYGVPYDKGSLGSTSSFGVLALPGSAPAAQKNTGVLSTAQAPQGPTTVAGRKQQQSTAGITSKEGIAGDELDRQREHDQQQFDLGMAKNTAGQTHADSRADRSYTASTNELTRLGKGLDDKASSFTTLRQLLDAHNPQSDAMIAPLLLKTIAGGQGSGMRMNEAEISRIMGARSKEQDLEAFLNKWTGANGAVQLPEAQRQQMYQIVGTLESKLARKRAALDKATGDLYDNQDDVSAHRRIVNGVKHTLTSEDMPGAGQQPAATAPTLSAAELIKKYGG